MKDAWNSAQNILTKVLTGLTVCILIFTMISVMFFEKNDRSLLGFKFFTVLSDSMAATDFSAGDLIIARNVKDPSTLAEGDIISFISQNSESFGQVVTHKIRTATYDSDGDPGYITYGTTTGNDDQAVVTYPYILGKYVGRIPKLGMFVTFQKQPIGYVISIALPFLLIIAYQAMNCMVLWKQYQYEQLGCVPAGRGRAEAQSSQQAQQNMGSQQNMGGQGYYGAPGYGPQGQPYGYPPQYGQPGYGQGYGAAPGYGAAYVDPEKAELMAELNALKAQMDRQEKDQMKAEIAELRAMLEKQQATQGAGNAAAEQAATEPAKTTVQNPEAEEAVGSTAPAGETTEPVKEAADSMEDFIEKNTESAE